MTVVGNADIIVRAITDRVEDDIRRAFSDLTPTLQQEGERTGRVFSDSFSEAVEQNLGPRVSAAVAQAGEEGGRTAGDAIERGVGDGGERGGRRAAGGILSALRGIGSGGGIDDIFTRMFGSGFDASARAASQALTQLIFTGNLVGTTLAGAVGGISALVSGLYAMVAAAGQAAGALAVLPGILGAVFQAGGAIKLAFGGVGQAISAGMKDVGGSAKAAAANTYAVADAQKALSRAQQQAARARSDANYRVATSVRDLRAAEQDLTNATEALSAAQARAREELQQLGFSAEGAALAEQRAAFRLEDAKEAFEAVLSLDPDTRTYQEALLTLEEADLAYRRAADRNKDLAKENKKAQEAGIAGHDETISAQNDIIEAKNRVAEAEEQVTRARLQAARTAVDSAQSIADAQERVRRAQESANNAVSGGAGGINAYNQALQKLSPQARAFVEYIVSLQDEFASLRASAGADFFPLLQQAIEPIVKTTFPILETQLRRTGGILGEYAVGVSKAITENSLFEEILKEQNNTLDIFNQRQENGATVMQNLVTVVLRLFTAIQPVTQKFVEWLATLVGSAEAATNTAEEMGELTDYFNRAGNMAALLGDIVGNLFGVFGELGKAASPAGTGLLESFNQYLEGLREILAEPEKQKSLGEFFEDVADNVRDISDLARAVGREFAKLGANQGIGDLAQSLIPAVEVFGDIGNKLAESGPALGRFVTSIGDLIDQLTQSGQIDVFFNTLSTVADVFSTIFRILGDLNKRFEDLTGVNVGGLVLAVFAISRALGLARRVVGFFFRGLISGPRRAVNELKKVRAEIAKTSAAAAAPAVPATSAGTKDAINAGSFDGIDVGVDKSLDKSTKSTGKLRGAFGKLGSSIKGLGGSLLGLVGGPIGLLLISIPLIVKGFQSLYKNSPEFKAFVDGLTEKLQELGEWFGEIFQEHILPVINEFFGWINSNMPTIQRHFGTFVGFLSGTVLPIIQSVFGFFRDTVIPILVQVGTSVATSLTPIFTQLSATFRESVFPAIQQIVAVLVRLWPTIQTVIKFVANLIGIIIRLAARILGAVLPVVIKLIGFLVKLYADVFVKVISAISNVISFIVRFGTSIVNAVKFVGNFVRDVRTKFTNFKNNAKERIDDVVDFFRNLPDRIGNALGSLGKSIGNAFGNAMEFAINKAVGVLNGLISKANKIPGVNLDKFSEVEFNEFASGVRNFAGGLALVGEEGPEFVRLPSHSDVFSNSQTNTMMNRMRNGSRGSSDLNNVVVNQNFYGPTTSGGRMRELEWTMRYSTRARAKKTAGVAD